MKMERLIAKGFDLEKAIDLSRQKWLSIKERLENLENPNMDNAEKIHKKINKPCEFCNQIDEVGLMCDDCPVQKSCNKIIKLYRDTTHFGVIPADKIRAVKKSVKIALETLDELEGDK